MTREETRIVDRIFLLHKLTKLCQQDCNLAEGMWSQAWRHKSDALEVATKQLSEGLSAYVAYGIHDKDRSRRKLFDYCITTSGRINYFLKEGIPEGKKHAKARQAVLEAAIEFGVVTSVSSLNNYLSEIEANKTEVQDRLNTALRRSAEAQGHTSAVTDFTEETAQEIAAYFAHLQEQIHNRAMSSATIFRDSNVGKVEPVWDVRERAKLIAEVVGKLEKLDNPAKRRREIEPLSWQEQRHRLRSQEAAAVNRMQALRPMKDRFRVRGSEQIKPIRGLDPHPRTRSR